MAKKFVRGVTDVKDIKNFDKSLTNVNDIISDGQNTYIHTKKGENELYYKLTDRVTSIKSTGKTITVEKSDDGTVSLKTNPEKVLEHENLLTDYGISKTTSQNTTKLSVEYTLVPDGFDLNTLGNGRVKSGNFVNAPQDKTFFFVTSYTAGGNHIQEAIKLFSETNVKYKRQKTTVTGNVWTEWREQVTEKSLIDAQLSQKEQLLESTRNTVTINHDTNGTAEKTTVDTNPQKVLEHENLIAGSYLTKTSSGNTTTLKVSDDFVGIVNAKQNALKNSSSIGVLPNNQLRQLYLSKNEYPVASGFLKTYVKLVSANTNIDDVEEEYNFILKINKGSQEATFTLHTHDKDKFNEIITTYGTGNAVRINGCLFTLSDHTLTVTTDANTENNYIITFYDIF